MNIIKLTKSDYELILSKFPEYCRDMLRLYTGQELFYAYKLCTFKPTKNKDGDYRSGDIFFLAMKKKMQNYLNGILDEYGRSFKPIHPNAWEKLGAKFKYEFEEQYATITDLATEEELKMLYARLNEKRIA